MLPGESEFIEKKSKFLGYAIPITSQEDALNFIEKLRSQHKTARHCVYAFTVLNPYTVRFSDDGEPQGTAGKPLLEILEHKELSNVCLAVVRYFGGILLGAGGLVRAYSQSATLAVDNAKVGIMRKCRKIDIDIPYELYGKIKYMLENLLHKPLDTVFDSFVHISIIVPYEATDELCKNICEISSGEYTPKLGESLFEAI